MLCKLVKEAEGFGLVLTRDLIGSALGYRAAAAKAWLERCRAVVTDLNNPANDQAALDSALQRAAAIAQDADLLSCNVSKDLERLKVLVHRTFLTAPPRYTFTGCFKVGHLLGAYVEMIISLPYRL